jgi:hypothetical protein
MTDAIPVTCYCGTACVLPRDKDCPCCGRELPKYDAATQTMVMPNPLEQVTATISLESSQLASVTSEVDAALEKTLESKLAERGFTIDDVFGVENYAGVNVSAKWDISYKPGGPL